MQQCLRLGLTGGIGSGKSTVAHMLQAMGAHLVDADAISRASTATNGSAIEAIRTAFGPQRITADGAMDRDQMRALVFSDPDAKKQLEAIVHPLVDQEIEAQFEVAKAAGAGCVVFDIPLLVESGHWRKRLDKVLVVDCLVSTQVARTTLRSQLSEEAVLQIIQSQASRAERIAIADAVIFNEGLSLEQLHLEVKKIAIQFGL